MENEKISANNNTIKLEISEDKLEQILITKYWENVPTKTEKDKIQRMSHKRLDESCIARINDQIQSCMDSQAILIYKTDSASHVIDKARALYYKVSFSDFTAAEVSPTRSRRITAYSGLLDANLSLSQYLAFFNIQAADKNFVFRFYHQDLNTYPTIYSIAKDCKPKLILARNPYPQNTILIGQIA